MLLESNQSASPAAFVIALIFWLAIYHQLSDPIVLVWAVLIHLNQLVRYWWVRRHSQSTEMPEERPREAIFLLFLLGANGAVWGAAAVLFLPVSDVLVAAFVVVVTLSIHSGGMTWMAPVKAAVISFSVPLTALLTLALILQGETVYWVGGVLIFLYAMTSWKYAMQHHKLLTDSLVARYEKMALAEQLARQVELVELASQEKTLFLAAASHDLRQPLHAIALCSAVLEVSLRHTPDHDTASRLLKSIHLLGTSFDAMLDISRLDAGTVHAAVVPVPLQSGFEALNNVFSEQAGERGLELRVRSTDLWVRSDAELLQRMLANLVANALKYTHQGGVVVVARQRQEEIWIDVRDTGLGMASDQIEHIFDEFYQINNPGRDRSKGLGIGLAIVDRLSRLLEHPIVVRSREGHGSLFRLVLPPASAEQQHACQPVLPTGNAAPNADLPERVMVLDDDEDVRYAIATLLQIHGVKTTCVGSANEAWAALQSQPLDDPHAVLLCDVRLANGKDGLDFSSGLAAKMDDPPRVILLTGETAPASLQRLRESDFEVLFKPVSAHKLMAALAQVVR
ncbi:ATP-binding response regulator [Hydrogenophaga crassostreae]|uniref:ATP-binding response regulator n=1 Tax=Hydrogenophaga crassostreae TaxID=1763535 RepID=UPI0018D3A3B3|nr:hybrid sensor histidine kinase/response regulator [Hydrogenophaga crassostreae]